MRRSLRRTRQGCYKPSFRPLCPSMGAAAAATIHGPRGGGGGGGHAASGCAPSTRGRRRQRACARLTAGLHARGVECSFVVCDDGSWPLLRRRVDAPWPHRAYGARCRLASFRPHVVIVSWMRWASTDRRVPAVRLRQYILLGRCSMVRRGTTGTHGHRVCACGGARRGGAAKS